MKAKVANVALVGKSGKPPLRSLPELKKRICDALLLSGRIDWKILSNFQGQFLAFFSTYVIKKKQKAYFNRRSASKQLFPGNLSVKLNRKIRKQDFFFFVVLALA